MKHMNFQHVLNVIDSAQFCQLAKHADANNIPHVSKQVPDLLRRAFLRQIEGATASLHILKMKSKTEHPHRIEITICSGYQLESETTMLTILVSMARALQFENKDIHIRLHVCPFEGEE